MFSNQNASTSVGGSRKIIKDTIDTTLDTSQSIGIIKEKPSEKEIVEVSKKIDFPFRKFLHVSEYFVLSLLVLNALYQSGLKDKKLFITAIIICFIYACSDEIHQSFLDRTSKFTDVLIDSSGSLIGSFIYYKGLLIYKSKIKKDSN